MPKYNLQFLFIKILLVLEAAFKIVLVGAGDIFNFGSVWIPFIDLRVITALVSQFVFIFGNIILGNTFLNSNKNKKIIILKIIKHNKYIIANTWFESNDDCESPLGIDPFEEGDDGGDVYFFSKSISKT